MIFEVKTESGSRYILDDVSMTWKRVESSGNPIREEMGKLLEFPEIVIGQEMFLISEPLPSSFSGTVARMVKTSPVLSGEMIGRCEFYDPHPGLAGCPEPIPEAVLAAATKISGTTLPLDKAIASLRAAEPNGRFDAGDDIITLKLSGKDGMINCWRVIRYKNAEEFEYAEE